MSEVKVPELSHRESDDNYPVEDWPNKVTNGDTRQSYEEWRKSQYELATEEAED